MHNLILGCGFFYIKKLNLVETSKFTSFYFFLIGILNNFYRLILVKITFIFIS